MRLRSAFFTAVVVVASISAVGVEAKNEEFFKNLGNSVERPAKRIAKQLRGRVCVMDFSETTNGMQTSEFGQKAALFLSDGLVKRSGKRFSVIDRQEILKVLSDPLLPITDDQSVVKHLQKQAAMDVLVTGRYSVLDKTISMSMRAVDLKTGAVIAAEQATVQVTEDAARMAARTFKYGKEPEGDPAESLKGSALQIDAGIFYEGGDGKLYPVREGMVLGSQDNYALYLKPKTPCHVYIYQVDASQKAVRIFPNKMFSSESNPLATKELWIPGGNQYIYLDQNRGREEIYIFATRNPSPVLAGLTELPAGGVNEVIQTMGIGGLRGAYTVQTITGNESNTVRQVSEHLTRRLAGKSDFFYKLSFLHQ